MKGIKTHLYIDRSLSGEPVELREGYSKVVLKTDRRMVADEKGLVHGGFVFSLADFGSMLAVNHPNVVLAGANVKFLKPAKVGDVLVAESRVTEKNKNKFKVYVEVKKESGDKIFEGEFFCVVTEKHVLEK